MTVASAETSPSRPSRRQHKRTSQSSSKERPCSRERGLARRGRGRLFRAVKEERREERREKKKLGVGFFFFSSVSQPRTKSKNTTIFTPLKLQLLRPGSLKLGPHTPEDDAPDPLQWQSRQEKRQKRRQRRDDPESSVVCRHRRSSLSLYLDSSYLFLSSSCCRYRCCCCSSCRCSFLSMHGLLRSSACEGRGACVARKRAIEKGKKNRNELARSSPEKSQIIALARLAQTTAGHPPTSTHKPFLQKPPKLSKLRLILS